MIPFSHSAQIARHFREFYFGGNWTDVNLKSTVSDLSWQQATTQVHSFNTIAALVYHINYYVIAVLDVLQGGPLRASDKYSFALPTISNEEDWQQLLEKTWNDAMKLAAMVEQMSEQQLTEDFSDGKYGNWIRNLLGIVEHAHYHLGQIVLIKKLLPPDPESQKAG